MGLREIHEAAGAIDAMPDAPPARRCVHCFGRFPCAASVRRPVCAGCRATEAALNGGGPTSPAIQPAAVRRPPGVMPAWTAEEDRVLARCRTAAEAHGRLPWRSLVACNYRFKVLRNRGRVRPFDHREWSPADDARVATIASPSEIPTTARELDRTVVAVHRRRMELRKRGVRVTAFRTLRPWTPADDAILREALAQRSGWQYLPALAERLGRTRGAVSMRLTALRRQSA